MGDSLSHLDDLLFFSKRRNPGISKLRLFFTFEIANQLLT